MSSDRKRRAVNELCTKIEHSQRRICKTLIFPRSTHRCQGKTIESDAVIVKRMKELAGKHKRFGYRRICILLKKEGWKVNHKKVHRLWRQEGMQVPRRQKKRRARGNSEGGIVEKRASRPNEVWTYDFLFDVTHKGQRLKIMPVLDEFTRRCLALVVAPASQLRM